jgi:8-oxo-dGTP pyrophosphatase MutT (NUDIX family)
LSIASPTRDFTVAVFVIWHKNVLLHRHRKLGIWVPPGGHIEPDELPEQAAIRETLEESGVAIDLCGERGVGVKKPRQLLRPAGIQLESISPGHEHIDLIYFGSPVEPYDGHVSVRDGGMSWYDCQGLNGLPLTEEVKAWCDKALAFTTHTQ